MKIKGSLEDILCSTKKFFGASLLISALTLNQFFKEKLIAQNKETKIDYLFSLGVNMNYEPNQAIISNVPEYIRNVPIHPDDNYVNRKNIAPIEDTNLKYPPLSFRFKGDLSLRYYEEDYVVQFGGNINAIIVSPFGGIKSRNYTDKVGSEERGDKAALTYYGFVDDITGGLNIIYPGLCFKILIPYNNYYLKNERMLNDDHYLFLEYDVDFFKLNLKNGWDRYNDLETKEIFRIADLIKHKIKLGVGININEGLRLGEGHYLTLFLGYVISNTKPTSIGKEIDLTTRNHFLVGAGIDVRIL